MTLKNTIESIGIILFLIIILLFSIGLTVGIFGPVLGSAFNEIFGDDDINSCDRLDIYEVNNLKCMELKEVYECCIKRSNQYTINIDCNTKYIPFIVEKCK